MNISDLLKLWRVEKGQSELAKMSPGLYKDGLALTKGTNPYEAKKAKDIYGDLVHMRQHKMLMGCLMHLQGGDRPDNLLPSEKVAYKAIYANLMALYEATVPEEVDLADVPMISSDSDGDYDGDIDTSDKVEEITEQNPEDVSDEIEFDLPEKDVQTVDAVSVDSPEDTKESKEVVEKPIEERVEKTIEAPVGENVSEDSYEPELISDETVTQTNNEEKAKDSGEGVVEVAEEMIEDSEEKAGEETQKESIEGQKSPSTVFKDETENKGLVKVKFLRSMPAFVGPDMKTLGPFEEDQEIELAKGVAEILLTNDAVELI